MDGWVGPTMPRISVIWILVLSLPMAAQQAVPPVASRACFSSNFLALLLGWFSTRRR
jgi:hypothetical protein